MSKFFNEIPIAKHKHYPKIIWEWIMPPDRLKDYLPSWYFAQGFIRIGKKIYQLKGFDR